MSTCLRFSVALLVALLFHVEHAHGTGGEQAPEQKPVEATEPTPSQPDINVFVEEEPLDHWGLAIKYGLPSLIGLAGTIAIGILVKNKVMKKPAPEPKPDERSSLDLIDD